MLKKLKELFSPKKHNESEYKEYLSPEEIVEDLLISLSSKELKQLQKTTEKDLIFYHMSLGKYIRNEYKLWEPKNPYIVPLRKTHAEYQPLHPDELSFTIIGMLWKRLQQ